MKNNGIMKVLVIGQKEDCLEDLPVKLYRLSKQLAKTKIAEILDLIEKEHIDTVFCGVDHINTASKILWQSKCLKRYILKGTSDPMPIEQADVRVQAKMWDIIARGGGNQISQTGWVSSFTGELFTEAEMQEYVDNTVKKLEPYLCRKSKVLEIGVASGLTCCAVAPEVESYIGVDLSAKTLEKTGKILLERKITNVSLKCAEAIDIDELHIKNQDVVIINSVMQYFPGYNYFVVLLKKLLECVTERAVIFLGDIMDQNLQRDFQWELSKCGRKSNKNDLCFSKEFIMELQAYIPEISDIRISDKIGAIDNELKKYRYDALLIVNKDHQAVVKHTKFQYAMGEENFSFAEIANYEL